ncbi:MAG: FtsQ-type POTRA domain-containing protein [Solibacillus sp.]
MEKKVIDITERVPALKQRRKMRSNFKFFILSMIFLGITALVLYFQSSYSNIQKIELSGESIVEESFYLEESGLVLEESLWGFTVGDVEKTLEQNDWVKEVKVKRKWLNTVQIHVSEWQKVAYIAKNGEFYPMLENGYILEQVSALEPIDAPIFLQFEDEALRKRLLKELAGLEPNILALISQINATPSKSDPYAVTLFMNDGYEVRAEITSLASKLNYYPSIIAQIEQADTFEKGIIDIEVGSYYRPFTEEYMMLGQLEDEPAEGDIVDEVQAEQ